MPSTPVLPTATLGKLVARRQANRWRSTLREVIQFRAYCCAVNSDTIMGVAKQPVPILELSPNPVCLGEAVTWGLSGSYAPGSTVTSYAIDMDDGTQYFVSSGSHTYAAAGSYTVVATVSEGGGRSQSIEVEVNVIDCSAGNLINFTYLASDGDGVYFRDWTDTVPAWVARNTGLEGNALYVNSLALRPGSDDLPDTVHELFAATDGGLFRTFNGGRSWRQIDLPNPSNTEFGDAPAATVDQLVFLKVVYSRVDPNLLWVLANKVSPARMWVYMSADSALTWTSRGLIP